LLGEKSPRLAPDINKYLSHCPRIFPRTRTVWSELFIRWRRISRTGKKSTVTVKNFLPVPVLCIAKYREMHETANPILSSCTVKLTEHNFISSDYPFKCLNTITIASWSRKYFGIYLCSSFLCYFVSVSCGSPFKRKFILQPLCLNWQVGHTK
jgi:hypothetical protein